MKAIKIVIEASTIEDSSAIQEYISSIEKTVIHDVKIIKQGDDKLKNQSELMNIIVGAIVGEGSKEFIKYLIKKIKSFIKENSAKISVNNKPFTISKEFTEDETRLEEEFIKSQNDDK